MALIQGRDPCRLQTGVLGLRIGFQASGAGRLTTNAHYLFSERYPEVRVEPRGLAWGEEVAALRDGRVDVAFDWLPVDTTGLHLEVVAAEPRFVGVAGHHPLAGRPGVSIMDLRDEPIMWTSKAPGSLVDWIGRQSSSRRLRASVGSVQRQRGRVPQTGSCGRSHLHQPSLDGLLLR